MTRYLILVILFFSYQSKAEDLIAVLDMEFIKDTEDTAVVLCFDEQGTQCGQWASFYLYKAKVREVISGEFSTNEFYVIYGRHALKQKNIEGAVTSLSRLADHDEADYEITEMGLTKEMYCFSGEYNQSYNVNDITQGNQLTCFEKEL